ncbi:MAG: hypothetical protein M3Q48_12665 [Actinomycetota bacterium]|nr:hypothetical protein [Actinomycetota bacterium]
METHGNRPRASLDATLPAPPGGAHDQRSGAEQGEADDDETSDLQPGEGEASLSSSLRRRLRLHGGGWEGWLDGDRPWAVSRGASSRSTVDVPVPVTLLVNVPGSVNVRLQVYVHVSPGSRTALALASPPVAVSGAQPSSVMATSAMGSVPSFVSE